MLVFVPLLLASAVLGTPPAYTGPKTVQQSEPPLFPRTFPHHSPSTVKTHEPVIFKHQYQHQPFLKHHEPIHHEENQYEQHHHAVAENVVPEVVPVQLQVDQVPVVPVPVVSVVHDPVVDQTVFSKPVEPQPEASTVSSEAGAHIIKQDLELNPDGSYLNVWNSENGITVQEQGVVKHIGEVDVAVSTGEISYFDSEGHEYHLSYVADENGFRVQGDHLPTPPPIPPEIARGLEIIRNHPYVETTTYTDPNEYPDQEVDGQYQPQPQPPQQIVNQYEPEKEPVIIEN